ncbi:putative metal-dependent hydrolase [Lentinula guzmanii]|uniref:Metal-dependent hydrolase n=3 Tax=Lentinula TaxID=5352 RepID=A0AA38JMH7_9AGAR|nr:putative metal-dependent hydrolase [Lentinula guzmanii]KAJ3784490.1 putative metal-dependent hydrolase [Lentinula aff. detonsa]KAJ3988008.1 putative metal-dependent hydrolase [Lentinula detonsa]
MTTLPLVITLEEHYVSPDLLAQRAVDDYSYVLPKLTNLGEERIKDMDAGSVTLQVLSHAAVNAPSSHLARSTNDKLSAAIEHHSKRLAAFAILPMADPHDAADELSRATKELYFVGALINNHLDGRFYDDPFFWPVFERAQELDVPIYIHPTFPSENTKQQYEGNYPESTAYWLGIAGWGWHADTGLHILRLFASGLFDKFPALKIIIGHMGELLPFQLDRIVPMSERWGKHERGLRQVWRENIWVTTSGMFSLAPLACLLHASPVEHIMFSIDYPFSSNETGQKFLEEVKKSGLVSEEDFEKIAYRNAERLLKVRAIE